MSNNTNNLTNTMLASAVIHGNRIRRATLTKAQKDELYAQDRQDAKHVATYITIVFIVALIFHWVTDLNFFGCLYAVFGASLIMLLCAWIIWALSLWFI
jgi:hypothetical protein